MENSKAKSKMNAYVKAGRYGFSVSDACGLASKYLAVAICIVGTIGFIGAVIAQISCLFIPGDHLRMAAGLWIGVATGIGMAIHMKQCLDEALYLDEKGASKYMQKAYAKRYIAVIILFIGVTYFNLVNILTLIAGVMGLKVAAYSQPIMHKLFQKLKFKKIRREIVG